MKKLKILQINETYKEIGGQERYFFDLIRAQRELGHEVYSFGFSDKQQKSKYELVLRDTDNFMLRQLKRFVFDPVVYIKLRKYIDNIKPDIIHLHGMNKSTFAILLACRGYNTIMTVHNFGFFCPTIWCVHKDDLQVCKGGVKYRCVKHECLSHIEFLTFYVHHKMKLFITKKIVKLFISPSWKLLQYLTTHNFKNTTREPYFVDINKISYKSSKKKDIDILYVGRLDEEKGVKFLLQALKIVIKKQLKLKVVIVGTGDDIEQLIYEVNNLEIVENVKFTGNVLFDNVKDYYQRAKILVIPSVYMDNFPCVGLEGLANGIPMIGSNRGGIPEWCIHDKTGLVIEPTNIEEFSMSIQQLLDDNRKAQRFSATSKKEIKKYDKTLRMKKLMEIYNDIIK